MEYYSATYLPMYYASKGSLDLTRTANFRVVTKTTTTRCQFFHYYNFSIIIVEPERTSKIEEKKNGECKNVGALEQLFLSYSNWDASYKLLLILLEIVLLYSLLLKRFKYRFHSRSFL